MHAEGTVSATLAVGLDESGLIRAAQKGDQDAFERLVRTYDQSVLRVAMNLLRSPGRGARRLSGSFSEGLPESEFLPV